MCRYNYILQFLLASLGTFLGRCSFSSFLLRLRGAGCGTGCGAAGHHGLGSLPSGGLGSWSFHCFFGGLSCLRFGSRSFLNILFLSTLGQVRAGTHTGPALGGSGRDTGLHPQTCPCTIVNTGGVVTA